MTLRRILNWAIGLPIAIVAVAFAVANRQWITVSFDPFSRDAPLAAIDMPLWALFFCGIFFGLIAGWIAAWFAGDSVLNLTRASAMVSSPNFMVLVGRYWIGRRLSPNTAKTL